MAASAGLSPSDFVDEDFHSHFQGITTLLSNLDAVTFRGNGRVLVTKSKTKGVHLKLFEQLQEIYVNPLVREHDVVSMMISGDVTHNTGQITLVANTTSLLLSANPRRDEFVPNPELETHVRVSPRWIEPFDFSDSENIIMFALDKIATAMEANRHVNSRGRVDNYHVQDHICYYVSLLRACHAAVDDDTYLRARDRLANYVYLTSYGKTLKRIKFGSQGRNFTHILTTRTRYYPKQIFDLSLGDAPHQATVPTTKQAKLLKKILTRMTGSTRLLPQYLYDNHGRKILHEMLSWLLRISERRLVMLRRKIGNRDRMSLAQIKSFRGKFHEVAHLVERYSSAIRMLSELLRLFDDVLSFHLKWLQESLMLKGSKDMTYFTDLAQVSSDTRENPDVIKPAENADHESDRLDTTDVSQVSTDTRHSGRSDPTEPAEDNNNDTDTDTDDESIQLDNIEDGLDSLEESEEHFERLAKTDKDWAGAAKKYLQLICIHEASLRRTPYSFRKRISGNESQVVLKSKIAFVEVQQKEWTDVRWSHRQCLESMAKKDSDLVVDELAEAIFSKTMKVTAAQDPKMAKVAWLDSTSFRGTVHCETSLLALRALAVNSIELLSKSDLVELVTLDGVFSVSAELLRKLGKSLPLLLVTKRCCPACWSVAKAIVVSKAGLKPGNDKIIAPGHHTVWTPVALPRYLAIDIAEQCLQSAEQQTLNKLRGLQIYLNSERSTPKQESSPHSNVGDDQSDDSDSGSSEHGSPIGPYSSDDDERFDLDALADDLQFVLPTTRRKGSPSPPRSGQSSPRKHARSEEDEASHQGSPTKKDKK